MEGGDSKEEEEGGEKRCQIPAGERFFVQHLVGGFKAGLLHFLPLGDSIKGACAEHA